MIRAVSVAVTSGLFFALACISSPSSAGLRACFDTGGKESPCAGTGQDGDVQAGVLWPTPRFADNGDGTITDRLTGIIWLKDASCLGEANWSDAVAVVAEFNHAPAPFGCADYRSSTRDWRLPGLVELENLLNLAAPDQLAWLQTAGFLHLKGEGYWSTTPGANPYRAWYLSLPSTAPASGGTIESQRIWPMRVPEPPLPPAAAGSSRFTDHGDGTVTDRLSGLMWRKHPIPHPSTWSAALAAIQAENHSPAHQGSPHRDWRLPNRRELQSLVDYTRERPALPLEAPFAEEISGAFWSSSSVAQTPEAAWAIRFSDGAAASLVKQHAAALAWPVRSVSPAGSNLPQTAPWREKHPVHEKSSSEEIGALPRFSVHGDGTMTDHFSGLMWLTAADCFGRLSWGAAQGVINALNDPEAASSCQGYTASYRDWSLPRLGQLTDLINSGRTGLPAKHEDQSFPFVIKPHGYWSGTDSKANLYYAWLFNLKSGQKHLYPKNFRFFVLPSRVAR
jgi:hypothetical protein